MFAACLFVPVTGLRDKLGECRLDIKWREVKLQKEQLCMETISFYKAVYKTHRTTLLKCLEKNVLHVDP